MVGYFFLGLVNNVGFVIMVAGAKNIAEAGVALVYLANIVPTTLVKITAPLWFDKISYNFRLVAATLLMIASFLCVALTDDVGSQLTGVALGSLSCGLGEASFLAMASYFESGIMLAAWSSGTGLAGIIGYLWVILLNVVAAASFEITILTALVWPIFWVVNFFVIMELPRPLLEWSCCSKVLRAHCQCEDKRYAPVSDNDAHGRATAMLDVEQHCDDEEAAELTANVQISVSTTQRAERHGKLSCATRLHALSKLWKYMIPLFLVYFSEYAMQSGAWSAIGFPVNSASARKDFYLKANLAYQVGVFVSRSSACLVKGSVPAVWTAPLLQTCLLVFFVADAADHFFYDEWPLVAIAFVTGLFGGFVYVNAFSLIAERVPQHLREFSLTAASMADSFGIIASDICALFIQACLYEVNGIIDNSTNSAHAQCPFEFNATVHNMTLSS